MCLTHTVSQPGILRPKRKKTKVTDEEILQECVPVAFEFKDGTGFEISILFNLVRLIWSHGTRCLEGPVQ